MDKLLYGTGNTAKFESMKRRFSGLNLELIGLKDMPYVPDAEETGASPLENARLKAAAYYDAFGIPVFSCDSGLYFDKLPDDLQPGVNVRTVNGKRLNDNEMISYYSSLAEKYGDLTGRYRNAICFIKDADHVYESMDEGLSGNPFIITSVPHTKRVEGFPLDSLSVQIETGKYYYDMEGYEVDEVAMDDGFLSFFKACLKR